MTPADISDVTCYYETPDGEKFADFQSALNYAIALRLAKSVAYVYGDTERARTLARQFNLSLVTNKEPSPCPVDAPPHPPTSEPPLLPA